MALPLIPIGIALAVGAVGGTTITGQAEDTVKQVNYGLVIVGVLGVGYIAYRRGWI